MVTYFDPISLGLQVSSYSEGEASCLCPFHDDHSPSATFNLEKGLFYCFACQESANVQKLAAATGGYIVKVDTIPSSLKRKIDTRKTWDEIVNAPLALDNPYLRSRHVTDEQVKRFEILDLGIGVGVIFRDLGGKMVGGQIRKYKGTPKYEIIGEKPGGWPLVTALGYERGDRIFITEGFFGALRLDRGNLKSIAAIGAGSVAKILEITNGMDTVTVFDNDYAGILGAGKFFVSGRTVLVPPFPVDEASPSQVKKIANLEYKITSLSELSDLVDDKAKFYVTLKKFSSRHLG